MNILKTSVKSWLKNKQTKKAPVLFEKVDPRFYESVANQKVKKWLYTKKESNNEMCIK